MPIHVVPAQSARFPGAHLHSPRGFVVTNDENSKGARSSLRHAILRQFSWGPDACLSGTVSSPVGGAGMVARIKFQ